MKKTIFRIIFCMILVICLTSVCGCSSENDSADTLQTTTLSDVTLATTTTTTDTKKTTATKATTTTKTITTTKATTTTTADTTTTVVTTVPTTTTTTNAQTVATTTTTTKAQTVATTKATTTAKATTTTASTTMASGVASTVVMVEGEAITVYYYDEKPENATLQAYSDLAEYGILTDEIRQLITADVMNYASTKYGFVLHEEYYANSPTDYNGSFHGGAKNTDYTRGFSTVALMIKWGAMEEDYIQPSLNDNAKRFQARMYSWVDTTAEWEIDVYGASLEDLVGWGSNVGFCLFETDENGCGVYQVSFIY